MKEFVFSKPLGVDSAPFGSSKKEIAPAVAAALIAGGSAVASGIGNLWSQADTNETNRDINESQIQFQRGIYYDQKDENRFLINQAYEREKELNDPVYKKNRLLAAGINPAFAMQSGEFGQNQTVIAGSAPSAPSLPSPYYQQPLDFNGLGIAGQSAVDTYFAAQAAEDSSNKINSDISYTRSKQVNEYLETRQKIKSADIDDKYKSRLINQLDQDYQFNQESYGERQRAIKLSNDNIENSMLIQNAQLQLEQRKQDMNEKLAEMNIKLSKSQIAKISAEIDNIYATVSEMKLNGESNRLINHYVAQKESALASQLKREAAQGARNDMEGFRRNYQDFTNWLFTPLKGIISIK